MPLSRKSRAAGDSVGSHATLALAGWRAAAPAARALVAAALAAVSCTGHPAPFEISGPTMGARYSVKIAGPALAAADAARVRTDVTARLARVEALFSSWREDSEVARFNRQPAGRPFVASPETVILFEAAGRLHAVSGGAFDVTVAPLVRAWGFGPGRSLPAPPDEARLAELRPAVDQALVTVDPKAGTLTRAHADVECDLSAIAPGLAADLLVADLLALGQRDVLVDVGGELRAGGQRDPGRPWRAAVAAPQGGTLPLSVPLRDQALATSGDYRSFYLDEAGRRLGHILDPRTLRPVRHELAAVTVVRPTAVEADGLATALFVLGPRQGRALAEREGWAALFVVRTQPGRFTTEATPAFAALAGR